MATAILRASIGKVYLICLLLGLAAYADQVNCIKWKNLDATTAATYCKPFSIRAGSGMTFSNNDLDRVLTINSTGVAPGAGGSTTQLQFNLGGVLSGSSGLTWNDSTKTLTSTHITGLDNKPFIDMVRDCGLVGDGVTDDATAAQTCLNLYPGWAFYFPPTNITGACSYMFGATLKPTGAGTTLMGSSAGYANGNTVQGGTNLCWSAGVTGIELDLTGQNCSGCNIRDLSMYGNASTNHLVTPTLLNMPSGANLPLYTRNIASIQRASNVLTVTVSKANGSGEALTQQVGSTVKITGVVGDATMNGLCVVSALSGTSSFGGNPTTFTCPQNGSDTGPFLSDGQTMLPTTGASAADGILVCTNFATIIHVVIANFGRHGINADSSAADANCPTNFSDDLILRDSTLIGNQGDGYLCYGNDCNAHVLSGNAIYYNVLWGIHDESSLGNTHIGNQLSNGGHQWASSTQPATKAISTISRTLTSNSSTVSVVLSVADTTMKLGSCMVIAGVTDASFNSTAGQCFFITSYTDSTHYSYIQPGAPVNASSSGGTSRMAKFSEAYLSSGVDDGASKIQNQQGFSPTIINQYVEGGQACKWGTNTILLGGANTPACTGGGDWTGLWINSQVSGLGGQMSLQTPNFIQNKDFTGETNIRAGITADKAYSLTWLNHSSGRAWGITADPSGTSGGSGSFQITSQGAGQTRLIFWGKDTNSGNTYLNAEGSGAKVIIGKNNAGSNAGTGGLEIDSGGSSPAKVASIDGTGLITPGSVVVASLPSAASNPGAMIRVSDSTTVSAEGQTCVGSSSNNALAFSNGSVWKCF